MNIAILQCSKSILSIRDISDAEIMMWHHENSLCIQLLACTVQLK